MKTSKRRRVFAKNAVLKKLETERGLRSRRSGLRREQVRVDSVAHALEPRREHVALGVERIGGERLKLEPWVGLSFPSFQVIQSWRVTSHVGLMKMYWGQEHAGDASLQWWLASNWMLPSKVGFRREVPVGDQDAAVLEVVVLVVGGAPIGEVLGLLLW